MTMVNITINAMDAESFNRSIRHGPLGRSIQKAAASGRPPGPACAPARARAASIDGPCPTCGRCRSCGHQNVESHRTND